MRESYPIWLLALTLRKTWLVRHREVEKRAIRRERLRELARALRVLKQSPEFITEASVRALLQQQRWTPGRSRAPEVAEFWVSPRGTETVLFPLRPDFDDYHRCLVSAVRDIYDDVRFARRQRPR